MADISPLCTIAHLIHYSWVQQISSQQLSILLLIIIIIINSSIRERSGRAPSWRLEEGVSPLCAYRVIEGGIGGQLCFRHTLSGYKCRKGDCRTVVSLGHLVANILINGSVLLQWTHEGESTMTGQDPKTKETAAGPGTNLTREETLRSNTVFGGRRHRRGGFELNCWWNGSYTQFECAGVHLGSGCRDFLMTDLHENIPYRICLRSLARPDPTQRAEQRDCVEFTLPPSGMQDIVIAMTTVGGAICVMLVIICLLVAYITENIMSPTTQHTYSYRTHSHH
ncbi:fibronectin type III domain-containing protein 10 [Pempheris klunzingeri]|uniref:fibronectin type III domain-containing protein 10 n=1 Tax=Pempheris klunzingeri TaxID=3127111 RepID=UPI003980C2B5